MKHYKKAILNVSDKDSPYALIDKYFPERESYFYQNRNKFLSEFRDSGRGGGGADIGDLDPSEVSAVMLTIHDGPGCGSIRFVISPTRLRKANFRAKIVNIPNIKIFTIFALSSQRRVGVWAVPKSIEL